MGELGNLSGAAACLLLAARKHCKNSQTNGLKLHWLPGDLTTNVARGPAQHGLQALHSSMWETPLGKGCVARAKRPQGVVGSAAHQQCPKRRTAKDDPNEDPR